MDLETFSWIHFSLTGAILGWLFTENIMGIFGGALILLLFYRMATQNTGEKNNGT